MLLNTFLVALLATSPVAVFAAPVASPEKRDSSGDDLSSNMISTETLRALSTALEGVAVTADSLTKPFSSNVLAKRQIDVFHSKLLDSDGSKVMYVTFIVQPLEYATLIMNFPFYTNDLLNTADSAGPIRLPNKIEPIVARSSEADVSSDLSNIADFVDTIASLPNLGSKVPRSSESDVDVLNGALSSLMNDLLNALANLNESLATSRSGMLIKRDSGKPLLDLGPPLQGLIGKLNNVLKRQDVPAIPVDLALDIELKEDE
ncbi:alcohol dehydrogenase [acceptor] [Physcia stellaris]|nr:alcohol dehydrogenase [acceptor] [Physcia stellaris]